MLTIERYLSRISVVIRNSMKFKLALFIIMSSALSANVCENIQLTRKLPQDIKANIKARFKREAKILNILGSENKITKINDIILKATQPYGYMQPEIHISTLNSNLCDEAIASVKLGTATTIAKITSNIAIPKNSMPLKLGNKFNATNYNNMLSDLKVQWKQKGYKNADFSQSRVVIDPKKHAAYIEIKANLGQKFTFGVITIKSDFITHQLIKKYMTFKTGDAYSINKLQSTQENLLNSGYFSDVDIKILDKNKARVPITINVKNNAKIKTVVGLGFDSVDSLKAIFNAKLIVNKFGDILNSITNISKKYSQVQLQYTIPAKEIVDAKYMLQTSYIVDNKKNNHAFNITGSYVKKDDLSEMSVGLNAIHDRQKTETSKIISNMIYPFFSISRKYSLKFNEYIAKQSWSFSGLFAKQHMASNIDLIQAKTSYYNKIPLSDKNRFVFAGQFGINYTSDPDKQPLSTMLALGGNNGLRGYPYNGIIDKTDNMQILRAISFEFQKKITDNVYGTTFIDLGQISNKFSDPWLKGVGVGAVYSTSIGDVNINIAKPLDLAPDMTHKNIRLIVSYSI